MTILVYFSLRNFVHINKQWSSHIPVRLTSRQLVVRNSSTKFHENPANGLVADADERKDVAST